MGCSTSPHGSRRPRSRISCRPNPSRGSPPPRAPKSASYDDDAIYVGVTLHDSDPSQIVTTDTRRDADLSEMDSFQIVFDTFRDQQNGFVFGTNAQGVQHDAQVRNQGNASNTDGSWDVKTNVTESGWTAEFRIPLRTLRYGPAPQTWGINAHRNIQRTRERTFWAPLARIYNIGRLSSAGDLRGLKLQTPRNLKVLPYVTGSANRDYTRSGIVNDTNGDFGFDAKFGVTPSLNLDATYNTDFAQVEVDNQQINLTRFNLRFPEKRPFFQENADLFRIGQGQEVDLFFSRRIGLDDDGNLVPIRAGGRLTGKVNGFNVGLVNMQTDDTVSTPANNFSCFARAASPQPVRRGGDVHQPLGDRSRRRWEQLEPQYGGPTRDWALANISPFRATAPALKRRAGWDATLRTTRTRDGTMAGMMDNLNMARQAKLQSRGRLPRNSGQVRRLRVSTEKCGGSRRSGMQASAS